MAVIEGTTGQTISAPSIAGFVQNAVSLIQGLIGQQKKGFSGTESISGFEIGPADPLAIPRMDRVSAQEQHAVELRINKALISGEQPSAGDLAELQSIKDFRTSQERLFQQLQAQFPARFAAFKIPFGTLIADVLRLLGVPQPGDPGGATGGGGVVLPRQVSGGGDPGAFPSRRPPPSAGPARGPTAGGFNPAIFLKCLIQSLLPIQTGGQRMPFQISPGPQASSGGFDFGGFLQSGLNLATSIFSKPQAPAQRFPELQQTAFPLLPAARALLPSLGAGAVGGSFGQGLADFFFQTGGAADLDEAAAFTDPVPGRCRPKAHVKTNPCTGKGIWFVPRGRPLVFSGDLSAARRLDRVAKTLDKARPKRRHHHHTKRRPR
ncbi:MAG TPA: hypothetical protein ENH89_13480 [Aurantimonas coralicida]|uniref:Uncharacterized protein n=1 Tax=Aurantimonas coralicida TaxID=182270 RepID=A0A9C9NHA4_9HYPH|nr:hypothetical protein [Aurantimonas coralicida]